MAMRLIALAATLSTGCSALLVSTPSVRPPPPLQCTTDNGVPGFDAVVSGLALVGGTAIIIDDQTNPSEFGDLATIILGAPLLAIGTIWGLSAVHGFSATARCRRFHRELRLAEPLPDTPPGETPARFEPTAPAP